MFLEPQNFWKKGRRRDVIQIIENIDRWKNPEKVTVWKLPGSSLCAVVKKTTIVALVHFTFERHTHIVKTECYKRAQLFSEPDVFEVTNVQKEVVEKIWYFYQEKIWLMKGSKESDCLKTSRFVIFLSSVKNSKITFSPNLQLKFTHI